MIIHDFMRYLIIDAFNLLLTLINLGVSLWLVFRAGKTHRLLTNSYKINIEALKHRQHIYKPLCIQGARGAVIYGLCYAIAIYHWQLTAHWQDIGVTEDIVWLVIELISMMTMLQFLKIGRIVLKQNVTRRRNDIRCPEENVCPIRGKCLTCYGSTKNNRYIDGKRGSQRTETGGDTD